MLQVANTAQSMHALNGSASMHVPLTSLPSPLPSYVALDAESKWHTSALQAAIVESLTLPTRLRKQEAGRATFDQLETTLSNEGNRRVAAAGLSASESVEQATQVNGHWDIRMTNGHADDAEDAPDDALPKLDVEFFPDVTATTNGGRRPGKRTHTFSNVTTVRGHAAGTNDSDDMDALLRDRRGEGPRTATYKSGLLFPALSSYPQIFRFAGQLNTLAIKASVSTTTAVADRIRAIESVTRRAVGVVERENLCDGLTTMAEEYEEGWSDDEDYEED